MITRDIQSLGSSALVELFMLDATLLGAPTVLHFHAGTNKLNLPVIWDGVTYSPLPIEAEGFDVTVKGTLPKPTLRVANIDGLFSAEVAMYNDLVGAKLTRKRTFSKYLDAANFPGGINPDADPAQCFPDEIWFIDQKMTENKLVIEWALASPFDLEGVMLPRRQVIQNSCSWKYRGAECGYTGTSYFTTDDTATTLGNDVCGKRLSSCRARFGTSAALPFGGFPGVIRYGS